VASRERTYGGSTLSARKAQRRLELVAATLDLIGEGGSAAVSVRSVCRKAGLTDRYFYESFAGRDELLVAVFNEVFAELFTQLAQVVSQVQGTPREKARAAAMAMVLFTEQNPSKGRLLLTEPFSEGSLIAAGLAEAPALTRILAHDFPHEGSGAQRAMAAVATGGAIATLFATWQLGTLHVTDEQLVEFIADLLVPDA
jgi:AcrR family transcriptional regulator